MTKIVIIGGGSSYTPELIEGVINHYDTLPVTHISLVDIEAGKEKLLINEGLAKRMIARSGFPITLSSTLNRKEALKDAGFVITQIRVGGLTAREKDERIPLKYGFIGQETTGIGGCFKALRTIPVILDICSDMEKICPDAFLINFTNPSGIVTEAVLKNTKIRCIGLCNCSINMHHDAATRIKADPKDLSCSFIGLNHLSVMTHAYLNDEDVLPRILEVFNSEGVVQNIEKDSEMDLLAKKLGCMLSPYLQYFFMEKEMLKEETLQALSLEGTRAQRVKETEKQLFEKYSDPDLDEKPAELAKRGGARYSEAAINLIDSLFNDRNDVQVVDVKNNGLIPFLPDDAVIETNCIITKNGAKPVDGAEVPDFLSGLVLQIKIYEQLTIEAALSGNRDLLYKAFVIHPLIHDCRAAKEAMDEMLEANRNELPLFFKEQASC